MLPIIMTREFIARSTRMPRSIGRLSASALSHHGLSSAVFITNIAESDFRHTQGQAPGAGCRAITRRQSASVGRTTRIGAGSTTMKCPTPAANRVLKPTLTGLTNVICVIVLDRLHDTSVKRPQLHGARVGTHPGGGQHVQFARPRAGGAFLRLV